MAKASLKKKFAHLVNLRIENEFVNVEELKKNPDYYIERGYGHYFDIDPEESNKMAREYREKKDQEAKSKEEKQQELLKEKEQEKTVIQKERDTLAKVNREKESELERQKKRIAELEAQLLKGNSTEKEQEQEVDYLTVIASCEDLEELEAMDRDNMSGPEKAAHTKRKNQLEKLQTV